MKEKNNWAAVKLKGGPHNGKAVGKEMEAPGPENEGMECSFI